jgi:hypothetical protein
MERLQTSASPPPPMGSSSGKQNIGMKKPGFTIHFTDDLTIFLGLFDSSPSIFRYTSTRREIHSKIIMNEN